MEQYDFDSAYVKAKEQLYNRKQKTSLAEASLEDLIAATLDKFAEIRLEYTESSPDSDTSLWEHINLSYNIHDGIVTVETAAKNYKGDPIFSQEYSKNSLAVYDTITESEPLPMAEFIESVLANLPQNEETYITPVITQ